MDCRWSCDVIPVLGYPAIADAIATPVGYFVFATLTSLIAMFLWFLA